MSQYHPGDKKPVRRISDLMLVLLHRAILLLVFVYFVSFVQTVTATEPNPATSATYQYRNAANVYHAASE